MTAGQKGAFELSLSFIIIVIFAVVLLTLGVTWLRGIFDTLTPQTNDLFQKSADELQKTFQQSSTSFAIYPINYEMKRGVALRMAAGVKNNAPDSLDHHFVINVIPAAVSSDVLRNFNCQTLEACSITIDNRATTLKDFMKSWVTWSSLRFLITKTSFTNKPVTISVPISAPAGTYQFGFVACMADQPGVTSENCQETSTTIWGGSMQTIDILVTI